MRGGKKITFEITVFCCPLVLCDTIKEYSVDCTLHILEMIHTTLDSHRTRKHPALNILYNFNPTIQ